MYGGFLQVLFLSFASWFKAGHTQYFSPQQVADASVGYNVLEKAVSSVYLYILYSGISL